MNNKKLGTAFEKEMCELLKNRGYWVHFITPDNRGAQPFDIIAVKDGKAFAIDCKTLSEKVKSFSISRLEYDQIFAFERWLKCGNSTPKVVVKWRERIYAIDYPLLKSRGTIKMEDANYEQF